MRPTQVALSLVFSHDGRFLISGGKGGLDVWDAATGIFFEHLPGHHDAVTCVTVSPKGGLLASASVDQTVRLWDTASWKELRKLRWRQIDLVHKKQPSVGKSKTDAGTGRAIPLNDRVMIALDAHAIVESPVNRQVVIAVLMPGHPSMRTTATCTSSDVGNHLKTQFSEFLP
jgi:WD40 repeat protein